MVLTRAAPSMPPPHWPTADAPTFPLPATPACPACSARGGSGEADAVHGGLERALSEVVADRRLVAVVEAVVRERDPGAPGDAEVAGGAASARAAVVRRCLKCMGESPRLLTDSVSSMSGNGAEVRKESWITRFLCRDGCHTNQGGPQGVRGGRADRSSGVSPGGDRLLPADDGRRWQARAGYHVHTYGPADHEPSAPMPSPDTELLYHWLPREM
jgi:hypothetical protein